jgi:formyl-CoA transferase
MIADWTAGYEREELGTLLDSHGVPRGDIYRAPEMLEDAHFKARETIVQVLHPRLGTLKMQGVSPRLSATPGRVKHAGPELGEHNHEVFGGLLGMASDRIAELVRQGAVGPGPREAA